MEEKTEKLKNGMKEAVRYWGLNIQEGERDALNSFNWIDVILGVR